MAIRQYRSFDGPSGNAGESFNRKIPSVGWAGWDNTSIRRRGGDWTDGAGVFRGTTVYTNPDSSTASRAFSSADLNVERSINVTAIVSKWESNFSEDKGFLLHCTTAYGVRFWPRCYKNPVNFEDGDPWPSRPRLVVTTSTGTFDCPVTATCMVSNASASWKNPDASPASGTGFGPSGSDTAGTRAHLQFDLSDVTGTVSEALLYLTVRPTAGGAYLGSGTSTVKVFELEPVRIRLGGDGGGAYDGGIAAGYPRDVGLANDARVYKVFDVNQFPFPVYNSGGTLLGFSAPPAGGFDGKSLGPFTIDVTQPNGNVHKYNQVRTPDPNGPPMIYSGFAYQAPDYVRYPGTGYSVVHCPWGGSSIATLDENMPPQGTNNCQPATAVSRLYARYCVRFSSEATGREGTPPGLGWADKANSGIQAIKSLAAPCGLFGDWANSWTVADPNGWRWSAQTGGGTPSQGKVILKNGRQMFSGWSLRPRTTMRYFDGNPYDNLVGVDCYANFANMTPNGYGDADDPPHAWNFSMEMDQTYSIEVGVHINTVNTTSVDAYGNGVGNPDGFYRVWVNGRLMYEHTGMVFTHHPAFGAQGLYEDWIHGGNGPEVAIQWDMIRYMGGYVLSSQYVGPYVTSTSPPVDPPPPPPEEPPKGLQLSNAVRAAMLDSIESTIGTAPILRLYAGTMPTSCSASLLDNTLLLAEMTLPSDWMLAASGGAKDKLGTWEDGANAAGTVTFFRLLDSGATTVHAQGSVTQSGGGGDLQVANPVLKANQAIVVTSFRLRAPGA
jgi:hypothetical protein